MTSTTIAPLLIGGLGGMEMLIILAVLVLLFGASKLPELARGSGQALKIFKAETKGLIDSDKDEKPVATTATATPTIATTTPTTTAATTQPVAPTPVPETLVSEPILVETPREHDVHRG